MSTPQHPLLVVGAGIAGVSTTLEAAEAGHEVVLVEREPTVGGRVLRAFKYFPKLCPPGCGMEINIRRLERNPRVRVVTGATVTAAERAAHGGWRVTLTRAPQYVNERCTLCDDCTAVCSERVPDPHNLGMCEVPAIRLPHPDAWPRRYVFDREACADGGQAVAAACGHGAVDLSASGSVEQLDVGAVVLATGWRPYPLAKLPEFGGGELPNVIANVEMERLASPSGPTKGAIVRPSDGQVPKQVAFVQCAGSRDVNHLPYCSGVCCLASLKQAIYVKEQIPDAEVTIYFIDRRAPGRNEQLLTNVAELAGVKLVNGKVGSVNYWRYGKLYLRVEEISSGRLREPVADLVVLATGMVPNHRDGEMPFPLAVDQDHFGLDTPAERLFVAGVARRPEDVAASVRDATAAAAKALTAARGG